MKKIKLLIIILVLVLLTTLIILKITSNKENEGFEPEMPVVEKQELETVSNRTDFYTVQDCVNIFLNNLYNGEREKTFNVLSEKFIKENNIDSSNVISKLEKKDIPQIFVAKKIFYEVKENVSTFYVYGYIQDNSIGDEEIETEREDFNIIVFIDYYNRSFAVYPKNQNDIEKTQILSDKIESNEDNEMPDAFVSDDLMALNYFNDFKNEINNNINELYEKLDSEYRDARFKTLNDFKDYIRNNYESIMNSQLMNWAKNDFDDYSQYVCVDQYENYYVFNETAPMQYTFFLDIYTIDLPNFIEKYEKTNAQGKVALNIQKFIQALNSQDYNYAYNCLDNNFKQNNYPSLNDFAKFAQEKLYSKMKVNLKNFSNEGELYIYSIRLENLENPNDSLIKMQVVMKLKEDRDFVMSFSIK